MTNKDGLSHVDQSSKPTAAGLRITTLGMPLTLLARMRPISPPRKCLGASEMQETTSRSYVSPPSVSERKKMMIVRYQNKKCDTFEGCRNAITF